MKTMRKLLTFAAALAAGLALAEEGAKPSKPKLTREEMMEKVMTATGGFIDVEGTGAKVVLVDARKERDKAVDRAVAILKNTYRIPVTNEVAALGEGVCPAAFANDRLKAEKALMVVVLAECDKASALAVFPEDRVAVINASRFGLGAGAEEKEVRLVKEIWRAIGFIGGVGYATNESSVMQSITSPIELDNYKFQVLHPMEMQRLRAMMEKYGAKLGRHTTYRQAVKEGWAAAPTNHYQQAIWDAAKTNKVGAAASPAAK